MPESKVNYLARIYNLDVGMDIYDRITLHFDHGYVKDGSFLIGVCGRGKTVDEAAEDYYRQVRGKQIVIDRPYQPRKEFYLY